MIDVTPKEHVPVGPVEWEIRKLRNAIALAVSEREELRQRVITAERRLSILLEMLPK